LARLKSLDCAHTARDVSQHIVRVGVGLADPDERPLRMRSMMSLHLRQTFALQIYKRIPHTYNAIFSKTQMISTCCKPNKPCKPFSTNLDTTHVGGFFVYLPSFIIVLSRFVGL
jgi:hypothetical protein